MSKPLNPDEQEPVLTMAALRSMADERVLHARVLLQGRRWAFAYYNAGYAVECALKACVLSRMILTGWVFAALCVTSFQSGRQGEQAFGGDGDILLGHVRA